MHADKSANLIEAAHRRHRDTAARAETAPAAAEQARQRMSAVVLARDARVTRRDIYAQPQLRARMQALTRVAPNVPVLPSAQRASTASQQNRLAIALTRNRQLAQENNELRAELETALGQIRAQRVSADQAGE